MYKQLLGLTALATAGFTLVTPTTAQACGGFFCNNQPVEQSAEQIVFEVDGQANQTTTHVQITYAGSAEEFAWIVPVSGNPEIELSSDELFMTLSADTAPTFSLDVKELGECGGWGDDSAEYGYSISDYAVSSSAPSSYGGVIVVAEETVGPYETVTLKADTSTALLDWLQANEYDLPDDLDPLLAPYVSNDAHFIALKLAADRDIGDLAPLAFTYDGTKPMIPIHLTSVAATPDMRLQTYVFSDHRAVPESYLHVQINLAAIDWFSWWGDDNYEEVITKAADEAGGHAFATDFSGSPSFLQGRLYQESAFDLDLLAGLHDPIEFVDEVMIQGFSGSSRLLEILTDHIEVPEGVDPSGYFNCMSCYDAPSGNFDPVAATADLEMFIVEPLRDAEELFSKYGTLTRMTSSISPAEMTVDPVFTFNKDMQQEVAKDHVAELWYLCMDSPSWDEANRTLVLEDGRAYMLPSEEWLRSQGLTEAEYMEQFADVYALIIEATSATGEPDVLFDYTADAFSEAEEHNQAFQELLTAGCGGCSGTPAGAPASALGLIGLILTLRRRRNS